MATKTHYATFEYSNEEFVAKAKGQEIARSNKILQLNEFHEDYEFNPVYYFPKADINPAFLENNDLSTNCPIKGDAVYWNVEVDGKTLEKAVWAYPNPQEEAAKLKGYVAFDISKGISLYKNDIRLIKQGYKGKSVK